ncbi:MAG: YidH family protein [Actinomycetes bacterium]
MSEPEKSAPRSTEPDDRKPQSVYGVGSEPDVQASLANERTALSWIRTGLALVAGGVALATLASFGELPFVIIAIAGLASLGGGLLAVWSLIGWRRTERALRLQEPLPPPSALPWLVGAVVAVAIFLAGFAAYHALTGI